MNDAKRLVFRFCGLPYVVQMQIAVELNLIAAEDRNLNEQERRVRYFRRAEQANVLDQLRAAVDREQKQLEAVR